MRYQVETLGPRRRRASNAILTSYVATGSAWEEMSCLIYTPTKELMRSGLTTAYGVATSRLRVYSLGIPLEAVSCSFGYRVPWKTVQGLPNTKRAIYSSKKVSA
jgi:hypothetical protein